MTEAEEWAPELDQHGRENSEMKGECGLRLGSWRKNCFSRTLEPSLISPHHQVLEENGLPTSGRQVARRPGGTTAEREHGNHYAEN